MDDVNKKQLVMIGKIKILVWMIGRPKIVA